MWFGGESILLRNILFFGLSFVGVECRRGAVRFSYIDFARLRFFVWRIDDCASFSERVHC